MNKTLKEIADELHIDKQKVYRYVKKYHINEVLASASVKQYDDVAQEQIKSHFLQNEVHNEAYQNHINDMIFDTLMKQLDIKDQQIENLQKLLNQEQQLNAINQNKIELLEQKDQPKKHWWHWR